MIDLSIVVPTILGAFISGLIGLGTVEYRRRKESKGEVKGWYEKTIRLAERIERVDREEWGPNDAVYGRRTSAGVLQDITDQIMNAPLEVENGTLDKAESFAEDCQWVVVYHLRERGEDESNINQRIGELQVRFSTAVESANELRHEAESARRRV